MVRLSPPSVALLRPIDGTICSAWATGVPHASRASVRTATQGSTEERTRNMMSPRFLGLGECSWQKNQDSCPGFPLLIRGLRYRRKAPGEPGSCRLHAPAPFSAYEDRCELIRRA